MPIRPHLTYANIVSTLCLFLALGGGAAFAASKVRSGDIARNAVKSVNLAPGAIKAPDVFRRAITSGKLAVGAVRSNQIADAAIGSKQIAAGAVGPSSLQFPVFYATSPNGGAAPVTSGPDPYPLTGGTWMQQPGEIDVIFGAAAATIAYDESGAGACRVFFEVNLNDQQIGGGEVSTGSTTPQRVEQSVGGQPQVDPIAPVKNQLTIRTASNGACTQGSTIDSTRFRVLAFG